MACLRATTRSELNAEMMVVTAALIGRGTGSLSAERIDEFAQGEE